MYMIYTVKMPTEPGEYVVVLADKRLLELPLESMSILKEDSLSSVTRDFSLQLFYSRLKREEKGNTFTHVYTLKARTKSLTLSKGPATLRPVAM